MNLQLYQQYSQDQILKQFTDDHLLTREQGWTHGQGWVRAGDHLLGFFRISTSPPNIHFCNTESFHWYGSESLPDELREFTGPGTTHLFVEVPGKNNYVYVADVEHVGMTGTSGDAGCEAVMDVVPPVPTRILADLGGLYVHPEGDACMESAVRSLRQSGTPMERFTALQQFVRYWRGPLHNDHGMDDTDVAKAGYFVPSVLEHLYRWGGRCDDVMHAGFYRIVKPEDMRLCDDNFVTICTECQWCGNYFVKIDDLQGADPMVYVDECGEGRGGKGYRPLGIGISRFLWLYYIVFNINGAPRSGMISLSPEESEKISRLLPALPVTGATVEQAYHAMFSCGEFDSALTTATVHAGGGIMGCLYGDDETCYFHFAGKTDHSVEVFLSKINVNPSRVEELI